MDSDMPTTPTPAVRSTIHVTRTGPTPAPRNPATIAPPTAARASRTNPTPVPAGPQRTRCPLCRRPHRLPHCSIFKKMLPLLRQQVAQAHGHCLNCLATTHSTPECTSSYGCQICMRMHHTLLHRDGGQQPAPHDRGTNRRSQTNHVARRQPQHSRSRRPHYSPFTRRRPHRSPSRRSTGLSNVVATLQQLQRLLG
ncbi:uncharacterized protein LOC128922690 [Zeugodacus cucurbitae]|uniref:uncharacterized protein LOC128922690 n=1 Tax=Zeugodacus cucurbitae TaxID=28588 RepID=UPI0023D96E05|nr:uncharacterized protein LOC128922690 [Zeugodacus cucurbitae]XP_054090076.1 uncharacterized protein LOC128922690 [Zeugodacus cucurbitae]